MSSKKIKIWWIKIKRQIFSHPAIVRPILLIIFILLVFFILYRLFPVVKNIIQKTLLGPKMAFSLLTADTSSLLSFDNRVNILILGISGNSKNELDLTDTIIFCSIDKETADTVMVSLPRDIWLEPLQTKINALYHYGEEKNQGGGFILAKDGVYQVINQPLHYAFLIDFEGFIKSIDLVAGIDLKVDRTFDDYKYPIAGKEQDECNGDPEFKCRWEHLHFEAGLQHFDGATALKFVRSRNAEGEEGTDFSRSLRQQKVIKAFAQKIFSYQVLLNPKKIGELRKNLGDHLKSDTQFDENQLTAFLSLFLRFIKNKNEVRTISIDWGDQDSPGFLVNPPLSKYNQWVLVPRTGNFEEIQKYLEEKIYKGY